jgi:hypothetical protein
MSFTASSKGAISGSSSASFARSSICRKWYSSPCALWRLPRTLSTDCRENRRLAGLTICSATYRPAETCAVPLPLIGISRRHQDLRRSCRQHYVRVEVDATHSGSRSLLNDILANSCHWTLLRICISATSITQLPVGRGFSGLRTVIFPLARNRPPNNGSNSEIPSLTILSRNLLQYSSTSSSFIR